MAQGRVDADNLTAKQRAFVDEYLANGRHGINAYKKAYGANKGIKDDSYRQAAINVLNGPNVKRQIQLADQKMIEGTRQIMERHALDKERIVEELARIAYFDPRTVFEWTGSGVTLNPSKEITDDAARVITEISQAKDGTLKVKLADKRAALMDLAKLGGYLVDKKDIRVRSLRDLPNDVLDALIEEAENDEGQK